MLDSLTADACVRPRWELRQRWARLAAVRLCPVCGAGEKADKETPAGLCVACWHARGRHIPLAGGVA